MSQTKAQLVAPIGVVTASGIVASGVITASSFDGNVVGTATSIISGENITVGVMSATGFSGDFTGTATGITTGSDIKVGAFTASSFTGDFTGTATSMMRGTGFEAGAVNATGFVANVVGDVTGNTTGLAGSVTSGGNIHVGVMTATSWHGDGSNLTGIAATNFNTQTVTANSAETIIDLADGNCITMTQSANTTVGFASTSTSMSVTLIRKDDGTTTTITWPDSVKWNNGTAPTLITNPRSSDAQQFQFITRDSGLTWYGWEEMSVDPQTVSLWSWGNNEYGQGILNDRTQRSSPAQVGTPNDWKEIGLMKYGHEDNAAFMAIRTDGSLWVASSNRFGELGQNGVVAAPGGYRSSPVQIPGSWATGSNGQTECYGIKTDGTLWVWGRNAGGMLGQNDLVSHSSPVQIPGTWGTTIDSITSVTSGAMAIKSDGTLWTWGYNYYGTLGLGCCVPSATPYASGAISSPAQVGTATDWAKCARGGRYAIAAINTSGELFTWGRNTYGELGNNFRETANQRQLEPTKVGTNTNWHRVSVAESDMIATKTDGTLWGWGANGEGMLGLNENGGQWFPGGNYPGRRSSPSQIGTESTWDLEDFQISGHCLARKTDGTLWSWGAGGLNGELGLNGNPPLPAPSYRISSPTQIGTATDWGDVAIIQKNSFAFRAAG